MEQVKAEPVAMVRVTHSGFGMELATHIAYALPEGDHWLYAKPQPAAVDGLVENAREVVNRAFDQYRARNGKLCSIEGDDGEKCWIVPFDAMEDLRQALAQIERKPEDGNG